MDALSAIGRPRAPPNNRPNIELNRGHGSILVELALGRWLKIRQIAGITGVSGCEHFWSFSHMIRQAVTSKITPANQSQAETLPTSGSEPLAYSIKAACHQLGDIGKTTFYKLLKTHSIKLAKLGARSVIAREDLHRLLAASMAARS